MTKFFYSQYVELRQMNKNTEPKNEGILTKMCVAGVCNWYFHSGMNWPYKTASKN